MAAADAPSCDLGARSFLVPESQPFEAAAPGIADDAAVYYVEFRVAENGVYGHSYLAHGRLGAGCRPQTALFADIHPIGGFASTMLGHFFPISAVTEPTAETLQRRITSLYRRPLSHREYQSLTVAIGRTREAGRRWNVIAYNCNDFLADVARAIGLRTPRTLMRPYEFIPALRELNEPAPAAARDPIVPARLPHTASAR
jgi:hypothetical protein